MPFLYYIFYCFVLTNITGSSYRRWPVTTTDALISSFPLGLPYRDEHPSRHPKRRSAVQGVQAVRRALEAPEPSGETPKTNPQVTGSSPPYGVPPPPPNYRKIQARPRWEDNNITLANSIRKVRVKWRKPRQIHAEDIRGYMHGGAGPKRGRAGDGWRGVLGG